MEGAAPGPAGTPPAPGPAGTPPAPSARRVVIEALAASTAVTVVIGLGARLVPRAHVATFVGLVFLGATWLLVWRGSDDRVRRSGLALGGLLLGDVAWRPIARAALVALAWAFGLALLSFGPYTGAWWWWWHPQRWALAIEPREALGEVLGQVLLIALPEEAFYRGYLQTRLDEAWAPRARVLGAALGPGVVVSCAIFAVGHVITIPTPARLAVFFPALAFGWLRARTGGIGAAVAFHALCNLYSELLGRGFGVY